MIKLDGMLMIGSAGSNVGKTELACAVIKKFSRIRDIIGIKVTTIKAKDGQCPRGGEGCGVCTSLDGDFCVTQETDDDSEKDTAKLLAAGAADVFWLRVLKSQLEQGITALLEVIGPDALIVCESNSLRHVVEPGLFLMVKTGDSRIWKSSANQVRKFADRIVVSDGSSFDFDIDNIELAEDKWTLPTAINEPDRHLGSLAEATAIIMAGGDSQRMGTDKSLLPLSSQSPKPIIEVICEQLRGRFDQILISANKTDQFSYLNLDIVPDKIPGQGPLMGIASALEASANKLNFVVACDIPRINLNFVRMMLDEAVTSNVDIVMPTTGEEKYEPLFAVYRRSCLGAIHDVLSSGSRKIIDLFTRCKIKYIELNDAEWFTNLNTMAEYEEYQKQQDA